MAEPRETSEVIALSAALNADVFAEPGDVKARPDPNYEPRRRRISYFMLFRLLLLLLFGLFAIYTTWLAEDHIPGVRDWLVWGTVISGFVLVVLFLWQLRVGAPRSVARLRRNAWAQSGFDVAFAAITLLLTGGVSSGFAFLFLIAVLGAATMGDRRQIAVVASASVLVYVGVNMAQFLGWLPGLSAAADVVTSIDQRTLWLTLVRNTFAIAVVAWLSGYLNTQLMSSVSQVGTLRSLNENILRSLSSGLLAVDQRGFVLFANPTAGSLLGRQGSIDGLDCDELLPGVRARLDDSGGIRNRFELTLTRSGDNRRLNLGLTCSPLLDEQGAFLGHIINFQDVTDLREMERILRRNERLAALGTLAASIAHEVRNPLAAISGCAELLEPDVGEEDKRLIRVIRTESARLADIVTDLLDYARPRPLERGKIELGRALIELGDSFRADPSNADIDLQVKVPEQAVSVEVDIAQLTQVLWNLVRNGGEAMEGSGRLEIELRGFDERFHLYVRDFGKGIEKANLERIFEPFFSTKSGGTGIGLAIVHRIVEEHGGKIDVQSKLGKGTQFLLDLPRRAPTLY